MSKRRETRIAAFCVAVILALPAPGAGAEGAQDGAKTGELEAYPHGKFAPLAHIRINRLKRLLTEKAKATRTGKTKKPPTAEEYVAKVRGGAYIVPAGELKLAGRPGLFNANYL